MESGKFYNKKLDKRLEIHKKIEAGVQKLKVNPLPADLPQRLFGPSSEWRVFKKQDEALAFASKTKGGLLTFAFEQKVPNNDGRRSYLTVHPVNLFRQHIQTPPERRCTYEVIEENAPCKLYFDLEYSKQQNPGVDSEAMVDVLNRIVLWAFQEEFGINLKLQDILILDASTDQKFSQHLIFQLPEGTAFVNNRHAGEFVKHMCAKIHSKDVPVATAEEMDMLYVQTGKEAAQVALFCDLGVYTKNRNFRLYLSTKFGKNAPLIVAKNNHFIPCFLEGNYDEAIFLASLITFFQGKTALTTLLECKLDKIEIARPKSSLPSEIVCAGYNSSPWPAIDGFVNNLVVPGRARRWIYYDQTDSLVFEIVGYRFCGNIGRWHKSNNIKYVVNIKNGTYYQSCFDPECQDYRSVLNNLPAHIVLTDLQNQSLQNEDDISDEILGEIADIAEYFALN